MSGEENTRNMILSKIEGMRSQNIPKPPKGSGSCEKCGKQTKNWFVMPPNKNKIHWVCENCEQKKYDNIDLLLQNTYQE